MSLGSLLLAIWLVLVGLTWAAIVAISTKFLGFWALVTGIVLFVEGYHPITIYKHQA
jgi:hypothetical protein